MRAVLSTLLALHLVLAAFAPHVHLGAAPADDGHGQGSGQCALCLTRTAVVAGSQTPDVAPAPAPSGEAALEPGLAPVTGAPLGAVPGQSPPSATR